MVKKIKDRKHCFFDVKRPCTIRCKAAYKDKGLIYCSILWSLRQMGWANLKKADQVYNEFQKKK